MNSYSPWNLGDRVTVTFEVLTDSPVTSGTKSGLRLVRIVGEGSLYSLPESCFVRAPIIGGRD